MGSRPVDHTNRGDAIFALCEPWSSDVVHGPLGRRQSHAGPSLPVPRKDDMVSIEKLNHSPHSIRFQEIHVTDSGGRLVIVAFALNSLVGSLALWFIVRRTKLCLDFSCTFHIIHLIICWFYNSSFPSTVSWWLLNAVCAAIMCICGEFICLKTELQEIPVGYQALNQRVDSL